MAPGSFGSLLRHHGRAAGLTQEALAERAELGTPGLAYLETGRRTPHPGTVRASGTPSSSATVTGPCSSPRCSSRSGRTPRDRAGSRSR